MNDHNEKNQEIREYSIRENIFSGALIAVELDELLRHLSKEEIMAEVISIAEHFENEHSEGTSEQFDVYCRTKLLKMIK